MKAYDRGSSLFWLAISIYVLVEALRLGIGTLQNPGMGFMAFGASGLLGIISLTVFVRTILKKQESKTGSLFVGRFWKRIFFVLIALLIYSKLMPKAGYLISTFLLMSFLFWIVKGQRWWWVLALSFLTTIITHYFFSVLLKGQFPVGPFGL